MGRLSESDALGLIKEESLVSLGKLALDKKRELHKNKITSFVIDRNINYTNICWVDCKFCAFGVKKSSDRAYLLTYEEIDKKIDELIEIGGTQILFQGGVHPLLKIDYYEKLVSHIHNKYPNIFIHGFSAIEIDYIAKVSHISYRDVLLRLQKNGMFSMPGAGAEILSDRVRKIISPKKIDSQKWLDIHDTAHNIGMHTSATMMFGTAESDEEIIEHWRLIRQLQDKTSGFTAFIMWSFQYKNTLLKEEFPDISKQSSSRYLRLLAVSRLYLDNFKNIQSSWVTQGKHIGQLSLSFGANDLGNLMMEENVVRAAGASYRMDKEEMINTIKDIGEIPAKRAVSYTHLTLPTKA